MTDMRERQQDRAFPSEPPSDTPTIGYVHAVGGADTHILLDAALLDAASGDPDPALAAAGQVGSLVRMRVADRWLVAAVRSLRLSDGTSDSLLAEIDFLGEGDVDPATGALQAFRRGITRYPVPGAAVHPLDSPTMRRVFATDERPQIRIGTVHPTTDIPGALFIDALLGKHFAILGSTGTGKSTATALILHRICALATEGHILMVDPHGEYAAAFRGTGEIFDVGNLAMPYWLMNFEEHAEIFVTATGPERQIDVEILGKALLAARSKTRSSDGSTARPTADSPIPYLLSDLSAHLHADMGKIDKATGTAPYLRLKARIDEVRADPRYAFMFSGMLVGDTMAAFLSRLFRLPGGGRPISIVDLSGVPSDITGVVVALIARLAFDYAIWSRGEAEHPLLLVCEEAHRYVPADRTGGGQAVRKILERIAKEGRKYGVALGLVTQRPSDLAEGVLSQCGTIVAMRLNNDRDQAFVKAAMPEGTRGFLDAIPALRNREAILCGEGVAIPVRIRFDDLAADKRPASNDPLFSDLWRQSGGEDTALPRIIQRWRNQGR